MTQTSPRQGASLGAGATAPPANGDTGYAVDPLLDAPPWPEPTAEPERVGDPSAGAVAACLVATGIACAVFGLTVVWAEASEAAKKELEFYGPAGSLSGKGIVATVAWLVSWAALHLRLRNRSIELRPYLRLMWALIIVGLITTFPPFFLLFAPHE